MANPYAPPDAIRIEESNVASAMKIPAVLLILLLVPSLMYDVMLAYAYTMDLLRGFSSQGWSLSTIRRWDWLTRGVLIFSVHLFVLFGAIRMWQCRSYWIAVTACLLSLVPVLTPGLILGIPVAACGLVLLYRKSERSAFQYKAT